MKIRKLFIMGIISSLLAVFSLGCGKKVDLSTVSDASIIPVSDFTAENQLMALDVESEEEAREIAKVYGIDFADFDMGVATFRTGEDPQVVIDRGVAGGFHPLYLNNEMGLDQ